jgi:hypothetical protein
MPRFIPPDPRTVLPSRANPEHRSLRKELEKKHGYGYTEPLVLTMLGIGLMWNIEHQVRKHEERKDEEEERERDRAMQQQEERRTRRRRRDEEAQRQRRRSAAPTPAPDTRAATWAAGGDQNSYDWDRDTGRSSSSSSSNSSSRSAGSSRGRTRSRAREYWYDNGTYDEEEAHAVEDEAGDYARRPLEYRGYRDQYHDYRNDVRYEDRRDGSVWRSSRRDSW